MRLAAADFHRRHPRVWDLFVWFTFEKINAGKRCGSRLVMERVRWETGEGGIDPELKINDHFIAFYARRFAKVYPAHADFFRTRRQKSEDRPATGRPEPTRDSFDYELPEST